MRMRSAPVAGLWAGHSQFRHSVLMWSMIDASVSGRICGSQNIYY